MPELQDLAREALEKARLFSQGFAGDIGQQLTETPGKLRGLVEPSSLPMPPQVEAGMKLMGLLPDIDRATSSGLGSAGVAGGREAGFYKPDSSLGEISLGPRELGASAVGMLLPTGKLGKAGKVEQIAAKAEQNLARVLERMGPGAQRLATQSAERKAAGLGAKVAEDVAVHDPEGPIMAKMGEGGHRLRDESIAREEGLEPDPEFLGDKQARLTDEAKAEELARATRDPAEWGPDDPSQQMPLKVPPKRYFEKFGPGAKRLDAAAQERLRANPPPTRTKVLKEAPSQAQEIDPHLEQARRILAGEREDQGGLLFKNYDTGKTEQLGEGTTFRDDLGLPSLDEAKQELGNLRYRTGIQQESVFAPKGAPAQLPAGTEKLDVAPGTDIISQDLRPDGSPWTERNVRTMPAMDEQTGKRMDPTFMPGDPDASMIPEVSAGKTPRTDTQQLEQIKELESQIGQTWSGSRRATGMERDRIFKRHQPLMEQYIRDELAKAKGDIWQTTAVKDAIREPALGTQPVYKDGRIALDEAGNELTYPSFRERIEEAIDKHPQKWVRAHQREVKPVGIDFTKRSYTVDPETGEKIAVPGGWETTPQGEKFLLAEAKAMLTGKTDPQEWAEDALRNKARAYALKNDPENPESVRHWSVKRDPSDTRAVDEGVTADDWQEFYGQGGPAGESASDLGLNVDDLGAARSIERDRPRTIDEISRDPTGISQLTFPSEEARQVYRQTERKWQRATDILDTMNRKGFTDEELLDKGTNRQKFEQRKRELKQELADHEKTLAGLLGEGGVDETGKRNFDWGAWKRGESGRGETGPMREKDEEAGIYDKRPIQMPKRAKSVHPDVTIQTNAGRTLKPGEQFGVEAEHSRPSPRTKSTTDAHGVQYAMPGAEQQVVGATKETDQGQRYTKTNQRDQTNKLQDLVNKADTPEKREVLLTALKGGERTEAQRLIENMRFVEKSRATQPEKGIGTKKNKPGYATGTRQAGEREATGAASGYKADGVNIVKKMSEIVDAMDTVRRSVPATSAQRKTWETYMDARLREMLQGVR